MLIQNRVGKMTIGQKLASKHFHQGDSLDAVISFDDALAICEEACRLQRQVCVSAYIKSLHVLDGEHPAILIRDADPPTFPDE